MWANVVFSLLSPLHILGILLTCDLPPLLPVFFCVVLLFPSCPDGRLHVLAQGNANLDRLGVAARDHGFTTAKLFLRRRGPKERWADLERHFTFIINYQFVTKKNICSITLSSLEDNKKHFLLVVNSEFHEHFPPP